MDQQTVGATSRIVLKNSLVLKPNSITIASSEWTSSWTNPLSPRPSWGVSYCEATQGELQGEFVSLACIFSGPEQNN